MVSNQLPEPGTPFQVTVHRAVNRFLNKHPDLKGKWDGIVAQVKQIPRLGRHIDHLKGAWFCSYRWDEGNYHIKYDVDDDRGSTHFYDADNRGDVYQGRGGARMRR